MNDLAPIVLFVYNRPDHTHQTVETLLRNPECIQSELFIFSDAAKHEKDTAKVEEVRNYIAQIQGFKKVHINHKTTNQGLANSVIGGVTEVINRYGKVIVLEDDIESGTDFLAFMNAMLDRYQDEQRIFTVSGYSYPLDCLRIYPYSAHFSYRASSWGWGTWKDRWDSIDWDLHKKNHFNRSISLQRKFNEGGGDLSQMLINQEKGRIDSWAVRMVFNVCMQNKIHLLASKPKTRNIGLDNSGTHSSKTTKFDVKLIREEHFLLPDKIMVRDDIRTQTLDLFRLSLVKRLSNYIKNLY